MRTLIIILLFTSFTSCKKTDLATACDVKDPIRELPWLAEMTEEARKESRSMDVSKAVLKDTESSKLNKKINGFLIRTGSIVTYYDCVGNKICASGGFAAVKCERYEVVESEGLQF